jgi:hypothetical protein
METSTRKDLPIYTIYNISAERSVGPAKTGLRYTKHESVRPRCP